MELVELLLAKHGGDFHKRDDHVKSGYDDLRRCRGKRSRAAIVAVLAGPGSTPT